MHHGVDHLDGSDGHMEEPTEETHHQAVDHTNDILGQQLPGLVRRWQRKGRGGN